ncbi:uncharacterized protein [Halyomorpha halys]|uniref:uncharacterized protein n=1 Tax=Halyomorpha halys TaxID=286706 RepID=UPI0006D4F0FF|nr:uncharacterized protein LOC106686477 [Halyomorpha halys]KAE8573756.1 Odorant-binding protein 38 [Halyomorpha halys]
MKAYIVALTVIAIVTIFSQVRCHEEDKAWKKFFGQCSEQYKISQDVVKSIVYYDFVLPDYEVACWIRCVMNKLRMIKEGKIDWENIKNLSKQGLPTVGDKMKVDKIAEICQAEVPHEEIDECRLAYFAAVCQINNWKELGIPKGNVKL